MELAATTVVAALTRSSSGAIPSARFSSSSAWPSSASANIPEKRVSSSAARTRSRAAADRWPACSCNSAAAELETQRVLTLHPAFGHGRGLTEVPGCLLRVVGELGGLLHPKLGLGQVPGAEEKQTEASGESRRGFLGQILVERPAQRRTGVSGQFGENVDLSGPK